MSWWKELKVGDKFIYGEGKKNAEAVVVSLEPTRVLAKLYDGDNWELLGPIAFHLSSFSDWASWDETNTCYVRECKQTLSNNLKLFLLTNRKFSFKEQLENVCSRG